MKCQKCNIRPADTHIKRVFNGEFQEYNLCSECAKEMGYGNIFDDFTDSFQKDFNNFLGSFFSNALPARSQATRCEKCGTSYADITRTGMMGCAQCYKIFSKQLMPTIKHIHGNISHCGKRSKANASNSKEIVVLKSDVTQLKEQLKNAVEHQEFEKAAQLRDKIKEMEEKGNE